MLGKSDLRYEFVVSVVVAPGCSSGNETAGDSDCGDSCPTRVWEYVAASGDLPGHGATLPACTPSARQGQQRYAGREWQDEGSAE
jgi:hypothetical protein